jgi:transposase InsO family protein
MSAMEKIKIGPLMGSDNYEVWQQAMMLMLLKKNAWKCVETDFELSRKAGELDAELRDRREEIYKKFPKIEEMNSKAKGIIIENIHINYRELVMDLHSSYAIWKKLSEIYGTMTNGKIAVVFEEFYTKRYDKSESIEAHCDYLEKRRNILKGTPFEVKDEAMAMVFTMSLGKEWRVFVGTLRAAFREKIDLQNYATTSPTYDNFKRRVAEEHNLKRIGNKPSTQDSNRGAMRSNKEEKECENCGHPGHTKAKCWSEGGGDVGGRNRKPYKNKGHSKLAEKDRRLLQTHRMGIDAKVALNAEGKSPTAWIIDSGASDHYSGDKALYNKLTKLDKPIEIAVANGQVELATHSGSIDIYTWVNDEKIPITLTDVLYVKELGVNLLSISRIAEKDYTAIFKADSMKITDPEGEVIGEAPRQCNGLYYLREYHNEGYIHNIDIDAKHPADKQNEKQKKKIKSKETDINIWHKRLGHIGEEALRLTIKGLTGKLGNCEICRLSKHKKTSYNHQDKRAPAKACLDVIYSDIMGPMQQNGENGERYVATYIDDYSDFTTVKNLKTKNEQEKHMMEFISRSETEHEKTIKKIITDNGGEYLTKTFREYCKRKGTNHLPTNSYNPQQNGKAERRNQVLANMTRSMLLKADLPKMYWPFAMQTAAYIYNRTIQKGKTNTPFEMWYKKEPRYDFMRTFGEICYVHVPKELRKKLDNTSKKAILVGYTENGYIVENQQTGKITRSRDVTFYDKEEYRQRPKKMDGNNYYRMDGNDTYQSENKIHTDVSDSVSDSSSDSDSDSDDLPDLLDEDEVDQDGVHTDDESYQDNPPSIEEIEGEEYAPSDGESDGEVEQPTVQQPIRKSGRNHAPSRTALSSCLQAFNNVKVPESYKEATSSPEKAQWQAAIDKEIEALTDNGTFQIETMQVNKKKISTKWIFSLKLDETGIKIHKYKARLVARGFTQVAGIDYNEIFAPVVSQNSLRISNAVALLKGYKQSKFDVATAFLNGTMDHVCYIDQPEGTTFKLKKNEGLRLVKALYGTKQAARLWNIMLHDLLLKIEFEQNTSEACLFFSSSTLMM